MQCDMCGQDRKLVVAVIEGSQMNVCERCSKFGKVISAPAASKKEEKIARRPMKIEEEDLRMINRDFARIVKDARERLGLEQHQLAERIAERESVIHRIESGLLEPPIKLAKKLEIALKIKLIEIFTDEPKGRVDFKDKGLTIGDLIGKLKVK